MEKNGCQTIIINSDGIQELKPKRKFNSYHEADEASVIHMSYKGVKECLSPYKCEICGGYHIGRNGRVLNDIGKRKVKREADVIRKKNELKRLKSFKPKIIGKIDLP